MNAVSEADRNQRIAADPGKSVFVTANAGSGKTKVLVDRIARLLLAGSKPSAFLCITYTKAAAAEMQRRLFERLGKWCVADDATLAADLAKLGASAADFGRARALFAQALETPGGLRIQTIHGFCERILARFPLEAGVPPGFAIADEARAAAMLARARAEAALGRDAPAEAFLRFAAALHGDGLDKFLDRLALRRADFHRYAQRHEGAVFADAAIRNRHGASQDAESFRRSFTRRIDARLLREAGALLARSSKDDIEVSEKLAVIVAALERENFSDVLNACFDFALTIKGEMRKKFVTAKLKREHPWLEEKLRAFAEECVEAREMLSAIERAEDACAALALAMKLDQAYEAAKARAGALDFDDLIEHVQALLQRAAAAPWVLYKLDGGIDHILIDEGQDTSPSQWNLIAPLQEEFFAGSGARERVRTIFAVGDPKQSIYGFQGADPRRFLSEAQALSSRARRAKQDFAGPELRTSFRSAPEILRVVDETFVGKELVAGAPGKHDVIAHLASRNDAHGVVEVWPLAMRPAVTPAQAWDAPLDVETGAGVQAILAKNIAQRVCETIAAGEAVWDKEAGGARPARAGDVLTLVRTRGQLFRELIKAFKRAGLPVAGADRMILRDELAVEDCLALMRVALDPRDDLALACVLKGPWCGLDDDDADIFPLAYGRGKYETLHARLMAAATPKYKQAQAFVSELTARVGDDAFSFLSWALEDPMADGQSGWARVFARLGMEARDPLEELLQRALSPASHQAATLQRFLYEIEIDAGQVKRELEAETDAIRVMTVHGAKGLEAPIVILPDSTGEANYKPDDGLMFDDQGEPFVSFRQKDDDAAVRAARTAHAARMQSEHWRLLYVAMTRARDRLIVCGAQHGNSAAGEAPVSWRLAVEEALGRLGATPCATPFGEGLRLGQPILAAKQQASAPSAASAPSWLHERLAPAPSVSSAAPSRAGRHDASLFSPRGDGQKRFRRGRLIHGLLQRLPDIAEAQRAMAAQTWLDRQGVEADEARVLAHEALKVIDDARFGFAFSPQSRAEAPIVGIVDGVAVRGVVDRLAVDDERVIVLDYKTDRPSPVDPNAAPESYVLQMALYREVLRRVFPNRAVDCALLWTESPHLMRLPQGLMDAALASMQRG